MDVIIPLASTSKNDFLELKITLRSLDQCKDVDNVYVVTTGTVPWIKNVTMVPIDDPYTDNKDKNIIRKVHLTLQKYPEINDFVLLSDDYVITKSISLNDIPDVYNNRSLEYLNSVPNKHKWLRRLTWTLNILKFLNTDVSCNWDAHVPARFNREKIIKGLANIDYLSGGANFTSKTLLASLCGKSRLNGVSQDIVKCTCESEKYKLDWNKLFIGYNDKAFNNGLKNELLAHFCNKSKYETEGVDVNTVNLLITNLYNINKIHDIASTAKQKVILFPCDEISNNTLSMAQFPCTITTGMIIPNILLLASLMGKYCILYDASKTYEADYISTCLNSGIDTAAIIYDPVKHRGIVNNSFLYKAAIDQIKDTDIFSAVNSLSELIKPSIIIRENEI